MGFSFNLPGVGGYSSDSGFHGANNDTPGYTSTTSDPLAQAWNLATSAFTTGLAPGLKEGINALTNSTNAPDVTSPASAQPTLADANTTAVQQQLASERKAASASSILTGGAGLLDAPTTASRTLLGS